MAVGGLCHVPPSLRPCRSPDTQAGWTLGSVSTSSSDGVNLSFWVNYILYSLLPSTNILTPHLRQPAQERSDSNLCYIARTAYLIRVLPTAIQITVLYKHVYMITTMQLWYDTVFICEGKKMATSPCCEKLWSNKIFTFFKYVLSHRSLLVPSVTQGKFVYLARLGSRCTDTSIFPIQRAVLTSTMGYKK